MTGYSDDQAGGEVEGRKRMVVEFGVELDGIWLPLAMLRRLTLHLPQHMRFTEATADQEQALLLHSLADRGTQPLRAAPCSRAVEVPQRHPVQADGLVPGGAPDDPGYGHLVWGAGAGSYGHGGADTVRPGRQSSAGALGATPGLPAQPRGERRRRPGQRRERARPAQRASRPATAQGTAKPRQAAGYTGLESWLGLDFGLLRAAEVQAEHAARAPGRVGRGARHHLLLEENLEVVVRAEVVDEVDGLRTRLNREAKQVASAAHVVVDGHHGHACRQAWFSPCRRNRR